MNDIDIVYKCDMTVVLFMMTNQMMLSADMVNIRVMNTNDE